MYWNIVSWLVRKRIAIKQLTPALLGVEMNIFFSHFCQFSSYRILEKLKLQDKQKKHIVSGSQNWQPLTNSPLYITTAASAESPLKLIV